MDRNHPKPFPRDVELVIMSLILILMAGYLGRRGLVKGSGTVEGIDL